MPEIHKIKNNSVLLHQIRITDDKESIIEIWPEFDTNDKLYLSITDGSVVWEEINPIIDGKLKNTNLYFTENRIGIGRKPLARYNFDIKAQSNKIETVFHVGDGSYGFSMGNGTSQGFIPEIIGLGSDENDAGLYFMGKTLSSVESNIPLIILGGLSPKTNRPLLGITSGPYDKYEVLVDQNGVIHANDLNINNVSFTGLLKVISNQQKSINTLIERINDIQKNL